VSVSLITSGTTQNQIIESAEVGGGVNQRLMEHFYLDLGGGYHTIQYVTSGSTGSTREDNYITFDARLNFTFLRRGTLAVFYHYSDNSSSDSQFTFTSNQAGFQLEFRY